MASTSGIGSLPEDLLLRVLADLDRNTHIACHRVCKGWEALLSRPSLLWEKADLSGLYDSNEQQEALLAWVEKRSPGFKCLGVSPLYTRAIELNAASLHSLKLLSKQDFPHDQQQPGPPLPEHMARAVAACTSLQSLRVQVLYTDPLGLLGMLSSHALASLSQLTSFSIKMIDDPDSDDEDGDLAWRSGSGAEVWPADALDALAVAVGGGGAAAVAGWRRRCCSAAAAAAAAGGSNAAGCSSCGAEQQPHEQGSEQYLPPSSPSQGDGLVELEVLGIGGAVWPAAVTSLAHLQRLRLGFVSTETSEQTVELPPDISRLSLLSELRLACAAIRKHYQVPGAAYAALRFAGFDALCPSPTAASCSPLRVLELDGLTDGVRWPDGTPQLTRLKALSLAWAVPRGEDQALVHVPPGLSGLRQLESLSLVAQYDAFDGHHPVLKLLGLQHASTLAALTRLRLHGPSDGEEEEGEEEEGEEEEEDVEWEWPAFLTQRTAMRSLELRMCRDVVRDTAAPLVRAPDGLSQLTLLTRLALCSDGSYFEGPPQGLEHLSHLTALQVLDLSENFAMEHLLHHISTLGRLERLNLQGAKVTELPAWVASSLTRLTFVDLQNSWGDCQFRLHESVVLLPSLQRLLLSMEDGPMGIEVFGISTSQPGSDSSGGDCTGGGGVRGQGKNGEGSGGGEKLTEGDGTAKGTPLTGPGHTTDQGKAELAIKDRGPHQKIALNLIIEAPTPQTCPALVDRYRGVIATALERKCKVNTYWCTTRCDGGHAAGGGPGDIYVEYCQEGCSPVMPGLLQKAAAQAAAAEAAGGEGGDGSAA